MKAIFKMVTHEQANRISFVLLVSFFVTQYAGASSNEDCWEELQSTYYHLDVLQETDRLGTEEAVATRKNLSRILNKCEMTAAKYRNLDPVFDGQTYYITLLDIAIVADDQKATRRILNRDGLEIKLDSPTGEHLYGGLPLHLAAQFESIRTTLELLSVGADPNLSDENGQTALHAAGASSGSGLATIQALVDHGANINQAAFGGVTPILMARARGNLRKAECLIGLGARPPTSEELEHASADILLTSSVQRVDDFLLSSSYDLPSDVIEYCHLSTE